MQCMCCWLAKLTYMLASLNSLCGVSYIRLETWRGNDLFLSISIVESFVWARLQYTCNSWPKIDFVESNEIYITIRPISFHVFHILFPISYSNGIVFATFYRKWRIVIENQKVKHFSRIQLNSMTLYEHALLGGFIIDVLVITEYIRWKRLFKKCLVWSLSEAILIQKQPLSRNYKYLFQCIK